MADLLFKCSHCSNHLVIEGSASGETLKCLSCEHHVQVPVSVYAFKCPSCSYDLSAPADVAGKRYHCPHCGRSLTVPSFPTMNLSATSFSDLTRLFRAAKGAAGRAK